MKPKRSRSGPVMSPVRVVAPMRVKRGQLEADRPGRRALADHDVELEVLHRRVQHLLDRLGQAVDLVDEQHVAVVEVGEDGGEVAGTLERGPARDAQVDVHLGGDDPRERGLAEAGRPREQEVIGRLAASACGRQQDLEVLLEAGLADELVEPARPQGRLLRRLHRIRRGPQQFLTHGVTARSLSASRRRSSTEPSSGSSRDHVAHLVGAVAEAGEGSAHLGARRGRTARPR